jgi:hypothetical protein
LCRYNVSNSAFDASFKEGKDGSTLNPLHASNEHGEHHDDDDDDHSSTQDEGNIELVLRTLQLMCEGHNDVLQNYVRSQPDNIRSLDLVAETVKFCDIVAEEIDEDNVELVVQTFETLVEYCQGCQGNQATVFNNHVMDSINRVIRDNRVVFRDTDDFADSPDFKDLEGPWNLKEIHMQYV